MGSREHHCEHSAGSRDHVVAREYGVHIPIDLMGSFLRPSLVCSINYVILEQTRIMRYLDTS